MIDIGSDWLAPLGSGGEYVGFICTHDAFKVILRDPDGRHRALVIRRTDDNTDWSFGVEEHHENPLVWSEDDLEPA